MAPWAAQVKGGGRREEWEDGMMTMLERVGEALSAQCMNEFGSTWNNDVRLRLASSAIKAMREPTEPMAEAALNDDLDIYWSYYADGRPGSPEDVWRVMIDAALVE
jgi:hypothetical protein